MHAIQVRSVSLLLLSVAFLPIGLLGSRGLLRQNVDEKTREYGQHRRIRRLVKLQGGPKSKQPPIFQKIVLKIANKIRFLCKVRV